jgi:lysophospholipase L1-like esterase
MTDGFEHTCSSILPLTWADYFRDPEGVRPPPTDSPISYPNKLRALLSSRYTGQTFTVMNEGNGGEIVADGATDLPRVLTKDNPQVLLIQEGANDVNQGRSPASIAASLRSMVREAKGRGIQPYVGTLLPMRPGSCRGSAADSVPPANDQIRAMVASEAVPLVDLYQAFGAVPGALIGPDGLHPSETGYQKMADTFFDAIRQRLEN